MVTIEHRQKEKARRKKELYEAARQVFLKKGYRRATIIDITRRAHLSPAAFYLYFESKGEVYARLTIEFLSLIKREINKVANKTDLPPEEKLLALRALFFKLYESDKRILINLIHSRSTAALDNVSPDITRRIRTLSNDCLKVLVDIIQEGMDKEVFCQENPVVIADIIWGIFSGMVLLAESEPMLNTRKDFVKMALETALDTLHRGINPVV